MGGDVDTVPSAQSDFSAIFKNDDAGSLQHNHPFILRLVIPPLCRRRLSLGEDPLYAYIAAFEQIVKKFFFKGIRYGCEYVFHNFPLDGLMPHAAETRL
jgi:hypothetical protein